MKNHIEIHIPAGQKKERLDVYLTNHIENATRNKVQEAIKRGEVLVNKVVVKPSYAIAPNDIITVELLRPDPPEIKAEEIPLNIVFEDEYLLVVNKPSGMVTHPAYKNYSGTLVNALLHHSNRLSQYHSEEDETEFVRPGIVHRLDKDTSGLLVIAKDEITHSKLAKQFAAKTTEREYNAIVWGKFKQHNGTIDAPLGRSKSDRRKIAVIAEGKRAITDYEVMEEFGYLSFIRLHLRTGRTHQIRVHLSYIHHPVFGDETYGGREIVTGGIEGKKKSEVKNLLELMPRQALHAKKLGFIHPVTKEMMRFESDLPEDMLSVLQFLRRTSAQ
jgi:23S rRNA pseudouridine1911/1915/1917 synthase